MAFLAVIADVRGSRHLADRAAAQEKLLAAVAGTNEALADDLVLPLAITGGDEMKALVATPDAASRLVATLSRHAYPLSLRFAVGRGTLATRLEGRDVGSVDGPCFHRARRTLQASSWDDDWLQVDGFSPPSVPLTANGVFRLTGRLRDRWTKTQWKYILLVEEGLLQKDVAEKAGVSGPTVSAALSAALYHDVKNEERLAWAELTRLHESLPPDVPET